MVSGSSSEQMPTIQVGALTAVCRQFADVDKKTLKLRLKSSKRRVAELSQQKASDHCWNKEMKTKLCRDTLSELGPVAEVLEKGKETGLTLSPEEVQRLCKHMDSCQDLLRDQMDEWEWLYLIRVKIYK